MNWYHRKNPGFDEFEHSEIPGIIDQLSCFWENTNFSMNEITDDIRRCLYLSNFVPKETNIRRQISLNISSGSETETDPEDGTGLTTRRLSHPPNMRSFYRNKIPKSLLLSFIKPINLQDVEKIEELAQIEYYVASTYQNAPTFVESKFFLSEKPPSPNNISLTEIESLTPMQLRRSWANIVNAQNFLLEMLPPGLFQPRKAEFLIDWLRRGKMFGQDEVID